jgi:hypothetical protein
LARSEFHDFSRGEKNAPLFWRYLARALRYLAKVRHTDKNWLGGFVERSAPQDHPARM